MRTNSKRVSKRIPLASSFAPDFLRLCPRACSLDHIRALPPRASFVRGRNLKKGKTTRSTGGPRQPGLVTRRGGGEGGRRRGCGWRRWRQGPASLLRAPGRASQPPPGARGLARVSSVPAAPAPVAPGAQPQMSSHNSRLAADSYKNCVWTISGEAPEFRAPVSCGVRLCSLKAPDQEISRAARPTTSQNAQRSQPIPR